MQQTHSRLAAVEPAPPGNRPPKTPEERQQQAMAQQWDQRIWAEIQQEELAAARTDWRPLFSYTANLSRLGGQWLGTDACWDRLSETVPAEERGRFLLDNKGSQYPWYWSAAVLAVLFGMSVCILNFRVKSLDRLK